MRVAVFGAGYVGLSTGVVLAERGHEVRLVDVDENQVAAVQAGQAPFHEPGLDAALAEVREAGGLSATTEAGEAVEGARVSLLCVGTPRDPDGRADLSAVEAAARDVGEALQPGREHVVATKSTVPPGTTREVVRPTTLQAAGLDRDAPVSFASNPEFLREGSALEDARDPDKVVVGAEDERAREALADLHEGSEAPIVTVDPTTAELIKYANNALLATKVSFANEMANLCNEVGADWRQVAGAVGLDERLSASFLRAGAGFGGSCFPKDVSAVRRVAQAEGLDPLVLSAVLERNERQPQRAVELLRRELGDLGGRRIALLGLSFKPGTDDVRNTRALPIHEALREAGAEVVVHDPQAADAFQRLAPEARPQPSVEAALEGAHGAVVQTAWTRYGKLSPGTVREAMAEPVVVDARRGLDEDAFRGAEDVVYRAIGLGRPDS